jgi:hypothetical protein
MPPNVVDLWLKLHADMSALDAAKKSLETFVNELRGVGGSGSGIGGGKLTLFGDMSAPIQKVNTELATISRSIQTVSGESEIVDTTWTEIATQIGAVEQKLLGAGSAAKQMGSLGNYGKNYLQSELGFSDPAWDGKQGVGNTIPKTTWAEQIAGVEDYTAAMAKARPQVEAFAKTIKGGNKGEKVSDIYTRIGQTMNETGASFEEATKQVTGFDENLKKVNKTTGQVEETTKKATRNIYALVGGFGSFFLSFAGKDLTRFGTMLLSPLTKFIALANGSGVGAEWASTMKKIENSFARIGAIMAETLMPLLKQAAAMAEKVAVFAEANPGLVKAAIGLGVGSLVLGKALALLATFGMMTSAMTTLGVFQNAGIGGGVVLGKMFGALEGEKIGAAITTKLLGSSPAIGATLGNAIGMAFLKYVILPLGAAVMAWEIWKFGEKAVQRAKGVPESEIKTSEPSDLKRNAQYAIAAGAFNLYAIIEGWKSFNGETPKTRQELANLALSIAGLGDAAAAGNGVLSTEAVDAYAQYDKQRVEMEQQYEEQRTQIVADNGAARVELESKYESDRNKLIEDYNRQASQSYSQYQKSLKSLAADFARGNSEATVQYQQDLAKLTVDFHQSQVDAQKDHQKRLRKLAQEHADNVEHLTNTRDALGLAQENRDYKRKVAEENAEFRADSAKRKAEYKKQVAELQQKYAQDEAKRLEEYNRQKAELTANYQEQAAITAAALTAALADLDKKHKEEEKKLAETEKKQLSEMESAHNKQEKELRKSLNDQLNTLGIWTGNMKTMYDAYYRDMETKLRDWITTMENQVPSSSGTPGMASGGYASGRTYRLHNGEFVMNPSTTAMAEKLTSGRLTQGGIIGALSRAGNIVVNQMLRFSGELGASDKRQIQKIAHESAMNGVMTAIGA